MGLTEPGGVIFMGPFLKKFFPGQKERQSDSYCQNDNWGIQLFTSSLYLAGMAATVAAAYTTRKFGRRMSMLTAGILFLCGTAFSAAAQNLPMLIIARLLLGCGAGFGNQVSPNMPFFTLLLSPPPPFCCLASLLHLSQG
ncbi:hypothetical protein K1719_036874 [Acacia pycnantha]|nr:hypothetical protein K1719_036874 [Acacia pycnantha]